MCALTSSTTKVLTLVMAELINNFKTLASFFAPGISREQIEDIFTKANDESETSTKFQHKNRRDDSAESSDMDTDSGGEGPSTGRRMVTVETIPIVEQAVENELVLYTIRDLSSCIRRLRESNGSYDNTFDCWDRVIEVAPQEQYLTFMYTLMSLAHYNPSSKKFRTLSIATARTYVLSLTIPGAKGFQIFDERLISNAIEVFRMIDNIQKDNVARNISTSDRNELWVNLTNLCDDIKIMFRYVHFDEYIELRNSIIWELNKLLYNNHVNGYESSSAATLQRKCYEIYDEITNAHNGKPEDTFMKIMRISCSLHIFAASPKRREHFESASQSSHFGEHISDWFVTTINKYPRILTKVLSHYIAFVVTNPDKEWRGEQLHKAFDYAAKYDAAMYTKCNESSLQFLREASIADDVQIRQNATEILNRLLLIEAKVNWELFREEVSNVPREVHIIKELINRVVDTNNSVKLKALNGILNAYTKGTTDAKKILTEGIRFARFQDEDVQLPSEPRARYGEIRYKKPEPLEPAYTFEGHEEITESFSKLPRLLYYILHCSSAHVRKAAINLLEHVVLLNPSVIYHTRFVQETLRLGEDPSSLVRKQALSMIDSALGKYLNCYPVVYVWCRIIVPIFQDADAKLIDLASECFRKKVFDNIRGIDSTNKSEHFMPWVILRVLLSTKHRHSLQSCINLAISNNKINQKVLDLIESHTLTSNSTEAWVLLSFIAGKVKSREPDALVSSFMQSMAEESWNVGQNLQIILEVLITCINDFSYTALNMAFRNLVQLMQDGKIPPCCVSKVFDFCLTISGKSEHNKKKKELSNNSGTRKDNEQMKWIERVYSSAEKYLLENIKHFDTANRSVFMSYLFIYTETNLELLKPANQVIVQFVHHYLNAYVETPDSDFEPEDINTLNQMIILAARFSIRDAQCASVTCIIYRLMLRKTNRSTTVNNIIVCITDLCKRHTQSVELALNEVLAKLKSPYLELRLVTFKNVVRLILEDLVKLRGNLLLFLLATLLDKRRELSNRATEFFLTYVEQKDPNLLHACLIECPFVFNGYMNFEGFESFVSVGSEIESPFKGREHIKSRRKLYKFFMSDQEESVLLMTFEYLKMMHANVVNDKLIQCDAGCYMIKDFLYILKEISFMSLEKVSTNSSNNQSSSLDVDMDDDPVMSTPMGIKGNDAPKDKRKKKIPTLNEAISVVEKNIPLIPKIATIILKWDATFEKPIDDLCVAISLRFENLTEFLKPANFWSKYRQLAKENGSAIKKKRADEAKNVHRNRYDDDENELEDFLKQDTETNEDESTPIPLLFKPFLDNEDAFQGNI